MTEPTSAEEWKAAATILASAAKDMERELVALRADRARLDWIEHAASARKVELARTILGRGFEIGEWPSMRVTIGVGTLRDAIDKAMQPDPEPRR